MNYPRDSPYETIFNLNYGSLGGCNPISPISKPPYFLGDLERVSHSFPWFPFKPTICRCIFPSQNLQSLLFLSWFSHGFPWFSIVFWLKTRFFLCFPIVSHNFTMLFSIFLGSSHGFHHIFLGFSPFAHSFPSIFPRFWGGSGQLRLPVERRHLARHQALRPGPRGQRHGSQLDPEGRAPGGGHQQGRGGAGGGWNHGFVDRVLWGFLWGFYGGFYWVLWGFIGFFDGSYIVLWGCQYVFRGVFYGGFIGVFMFLI